MESKKSNLFVGDRSFAQNWTLGFKEKGTEHKFLSESLRFHWQSLRYLYCLTLGISLYLYLSGELELVSFTISLGSLVMVYFTQDIIIKRLILQILCLVWELSLFKGGSIPECFGIFLPSFILNFFMLKCWTMSGLFFIAEVIIIHHQTNASLLNLILSAFTYVFINSTLEKDFRDIWHLYSSYKKSNCLNKALWDTFPGAELLLNKEGKIVLHNKAAVEVLKLQGKSTDILKGGNFEDFFTDFQDQAKSLIVKAMRGEFCEEIHLNKPPNAFKDSVSELGYLITGDLISWVTGNCVRIMCIDVTGHISKKFLILNSLKDIQGYVESFLKTISQTYFEEEKLSKESVTTFFRIYHSFTAINAIQSHFIGFIELQNQNFDVNTEIINAIEMLYLKTCKHNLGVTYTREKGIPSTIIGDKSLHNAVVYSLLDFVIENCIEGTDISLLVQVSVRNI
jgi:hypothetical protein